MYVIKTKREIALIVWFALVEVIDVHNDLNEAEV